jgi:hypothetical protein
LDVPSEAADDFTVTGKGFKVEKVSFLGLFTGKTKIEDIDLAFYNLFPEDSDLTRTPVTVRTNGPADDEFTALSLGENQLTFKTTNLGSFTVDQTILPGSGPNAPGLGSGVVGGPLTGKLRQIDVELATPLKLAAGPVFLVAAVDPVKGSDYFWVGGKRPPTFPSPLPAGVADRQTWFRTNEPFDDALEPDWVRVSDVINQQNNTAEPAFNAAFKVTGDRVYGAGATRESVPEPSSVLGILLFGGFPLFHYLRRRKRRSAA